MEYTCIDSNEAVNLNQTICYPTLESEFEVQSYIYWTLKNRGIDIRGEVSTRTFSLENRAVLPRTVNKKNQGERCRFDLVIFRNKTAFIIIEVKKKLKLSRSGRKQKKDQRNRYPCFGAKVIICTGMKQARKLCDDLLAELQADSSANTSR